MDQVSKFVFESGRSEARPLRFALAAIHAGLLRSVRTIDHTLPPSTSREILNERGLGAYLSAAGTLREAGAITMAELDLVSRAVARVAGATDRILGSGPTGSYLFLPDPQSVARAADPAASFVVRQYAKDADFCHWAASALSSGNSFPDKSTDFAKIPGALAVLARDLRAEPFESLAYAIARDTEEADPTGCVDVGRPVVMEAVRAWVASLLKAASARAFKVAWARTLEVQRAYGFGHKDVTSALDGLGRSASCRLENRALSGNPSVCEKALRKIASLATEEGRSWPFSVPSLSNERAPEALDIFLPRRRR